MVSRRPAAALALLLAGMPAAAQKAAKAPSPLDAKELRQRDAMEHFLRARMHAAAAEFESALKEFRKAVELDPEDGALRREYAETLRDLGVMPEAEREARKAVELLPESPSAHRVLGQILLATAKTRPDVEAAAGELKKANDVNPREPQAAVGLGQALLRLDRPKEAAEVLSRVLDRGRNDAIPLLYGEALEKSGQLQDAEELYASLRRLDPENRAAVVGLLRVYERGRQWEKAIPLVERILKEQPGNVGVRVQLASLQLRARKFDEAERTYQAILKNDADNRDALRQYAALLTETRETDKADETLRKLAALDPEDPDVPFRRAVNFIEARRLDDAEGILQELRKKLVAQKAPAGALGQVDGQLGYLAYLRKDWSGARERLTPHLFDDEGLNGQAYNLLLQIARDTDQPAEGLKVARLALEKAGDKRPVLLRSTVAEFQFRSADAALRKEGESAIDALAGEDRASALAAADVWQRLDRYDRAWRTAKDALGRYPDDVDLLFRLAASYERDKKIPEAVAAFEKLLALRPDHAPALNYLGYMWADRSENLRRALQLIQKAVDLDPSNAAYLDSLGWAHYRLGDLDKAETWLTLAARLQPDDAAIEDHLGDLWERRGDLDRARASWRKALTMKPDDGGKKIEEKLRRIDSRSARKSE